MRTLLLLLVALLCTASAASAQRGEMAPVTVEQLGNFEIQDLIITIQYANVPRGDAPVSARITVQAPEGGRLDIPTLHIGGTMGDEPAMVALRQTGDGTLSGQGMIPHPSQTETLRLRMDEGGKLGFNIGMPPTIRGDFRGGAEADGIKIEISMDWPLDVDIVIET
ncbi:MAG: hypothetical protein AAFQ43_00015 [Bacteroidota bacterium]